MGTGKRKTWKNGKAFSSQGKVRELCQDWKSPGKVGEFYSKYWKNQTKLCWKIEKKKKKKKKYWKNQGNLLASNSENLQIWYHTLNKKRTLKNTGKLQKITGKVGEICQSEKVGTMKIPSAFSGSRTL